MRLLLLNLGLDGSKKDLVLFYGRPCFDRIWILQEVSLSRKVEVICRNTAISLPHLMVLAGEYFASHMGRRDLALPLWSHGSLIDWITIAWTGSRADAL